MSFTSKRGRPAKLTVIDGGKKDPFEKLPKRRITVKIAQEPLDICLEKGLITNEYHRAGIHFRWLYTLRFGAPSVSATELDTTYKKAIRNEDLQWQEEREKEYAMAVEKLRKIGALKIVMNIAVFNHFPRFLTGYKAHNKQQMEQNYKEVNKLREGLEALFALWLK